jgi:hypothetical protein
VVTMVRLCNGLDCLIMSGMTITVYFSGAGVPRGLCCTIFSKNLRVVSKVCGIVRDWNNTE